MTAKCTSPSNQPSSSASCVLPLKIGQSLSAEAESSPCFESFLDRMKVHSPLEIQDRRSRIKGPSLLVSALGHESPQLDAYLRSNRPRLFKAIRLFLKWRMRPSLAGTFCGTPVAPTELGGLAEESGTQMNKMLLKILGFAVAGLIVVALGFYFAMCHEASRKRSSRPVDSLAVLGTQ